MKLISVTLAHWNNAEQTSLDCQATFDKGTFPYTAENETGDVMVQKVWDMATAGTVAAYVARTQ